MSTNDPIFSIYHLNEDKATVGKFICAAPLDAMGLILRLQQPAIDRINNEALNGKFCDLFACGYDRMLNVRVIYWGDRWQFDSEDGEDT